MNTNYSTLFNSNPFINSLSDKTSTIRKGWVYFINRRYFTRAGAQNAVYRFESENNIILNYDIKKRGFMGYYVEVL